VQDRGAARLIGLHHRKAYILDMWREKVEFSDLWNAVQRLAREHCPKSLLIEDTGNGTALLQRLRNEEPKGVPSPIAQARRLSTLSGLFVHTMRLRH
jgi:phage terminase large subunit-like protein